jgi:hypothetical protein
MKDLKCSSFPVCIVSQFKKKSLELSNFRIQNSHTVPALEWTEARNGEWCMASALAVVFRSGAHIVQQEWENISIGRIAGTLVSVEFHGFSKPELNTQFAIHSGLANEFDSRQALDSKERVRQPWPSCGE